MDVCKRADWGAVPLVGEDTKVEGLRDGRKGRSRPRENEGSLTELKR